MAILIGFALTGAGCDPPQTHELPALSRLAMLGNLAADSTRILYQYYEKFGFTDVCIHHRALIHCDVPPSGVDGWVSLPFAPLELEHINGMSNKVDSISDGPILNAMFMEKQSFSDISLERWEYVMDSVSLEVPLWRGKYHFTGDSLLIYDEEKGNLYLEVHQCDG
ncbi:MAG: hypothetical protein H6585_06505 [Flavobacteriales bacterium]|nr:hypothetical protein [Flavobacteriales bacterium]MCB9447980.1 hypothetical protein [Flavobacteriales bacterium]